MLNNLPNLLIIGAAKSGTTSLHNYLNQHPEVYMCFPKEPHFLINKEIGAQRIPKGVLKLEDYKKLFAGNEDKKYRGESSVMYLSFPEITIANIKKYLSDDVKIIIMLRNPVERAYSGYQHVKRYNVMETLTFEDALKQTKERYENTHNMTPASRYLELGMYYKQVKAFSESLKNIHIIIYDDYKASFKEEMKKVFSFLEIDFLEINSEKKHMVGGWQWKSEWIKKMMTQPNILKNLLKYIFPFKSLRKGIKHFFQKGSVQQVEKINHETEQYLKTYYKNDVKKLERILNKKMNWNL